MARGGAVVEAERLFPNVQPPRGRNTIICINRLFEGTGKF
jgi:hypothetical protein